MTKGLSPTQRTLQALREQGLICAIVEKFNQFGGKFGIRQDLFNIIDVLALDGDNTIGVQCCASDHKAHFDKITIEHAQETIEWLKSPYRKLYIYSWRKVKLKRGGLAMRWQAKIQEIIMTDIIPEPETDIDNPF
jgi:hypothetical protein